MEFDKICMVKIGHERMAVIEVTFATSTHVCVQILYKDFTLLDFALRTEVLPKMGIEVPSLREGSLILMGEDGMVIGTTGPRKGYSRGDGLIPVGGYPRPFSFIRAGFLHGLWPSINFSGGENAGKSTVKLTKDTIATINGRKSILVMTFDAQLPSGTPDRYRSICIHEKAFTHMLGLAYEKLPNETELVVDVFGYFEDHPYGVDV